MLPIIVYLHYFSIVKLYHSVLVKFNNLPEKLFELKAFSLVKKVMTNRKKYTSIRVIQLIAPKKLVCEKYCKKFDRSTEYRLSANTS